MSASEEPNRFELPGSAILAYLAAVIAGSAASLLLPMLWNDITHLDKIVSHPRLLFAADGEHPTIFLYLFLPMVFSILVAIISLFALWFTIVPVFIFGFIYIYFGIRNLLYFLSAGALTGCLIALLWSETAFPVRNVLVLAQWPFMSASGAIGGLAYWWVAIWRQRHKPINKSAESC